jgi:hypothetical protein
MGGKPPAATPVALPKMVCDDDFKMGIFVIPMHRGSLMTPQQTVVRLYTPPVSTASQWRGRLKAHPALAQAPWQEVAVQQANTALSLAALTPAASQWMLSYGGELTSALLEVAGQPLQMRLEEHEVDSVREQHFLWCYEAPRLVVAKDARHWQEYAAPQLSEASRQRLTQRLNRDLAAQAAAWGFDGAPCVSIIDEGSPMPFVNAIRGECNGRGQPLNVLGRTGMRLVSTQRLSGWWFVGPLATLGYGRLHRAGYAAASDVDARNAAELGIELRQEPLERQQA